mmetsp:Transcript_44754/g.52453  ORF Transcript_44754/g.52453 Transcript_44754/m.52453 type:complete len:297 (+) Transcript_44754:78-968(+)
MDEYVIEPNTKTMFPKERNGMTCVGCGSRVKYFITFYAVATYIPKQPLENLRGKTPVEIQNYLLLKPDPNTKDHHKHDHTATSCTTSKPQPILCIRIVPYRSIPAEFYSNAIMDSLIPRLKFIMGTTKKQGINDNGNEEDDAFDFDEYILDLKQQFRAFIHLDAEAGSIMEMTIEKSNDVDNENKHDLKMVFWSSMGSRGEINSKDFCRALCMVYYEGGSGLAIGDTGNRIDGNAFSTSTIVVEGQQGSECVSVDHRDNVMRGILGVKDDNGSKADADNRSYWGVSNFVKQGLKKL